MEICSRSLSFWQYQIHQESSFQQAVSRNLNDRNAQLQKQLENVIREANGEIRLLGDKITGATIYIDRYLASLRARAGA